MSTDRGRPPLFDWLEALARSAVARELEPQAIGLALLAAIESRGTTGEDAKASVAQAETLGLSERQMRRHLAVLVERGWLTQTARGIRGKAGQPGRVARYRLTRPRRRMSSDSDSDEMTPDRSNVSSDPSNHMTSPAESHDTEHAQSRLGTPSQGSPVSHPSAPTTGGADDMDDDIEIREPYRSDCRDFAPDASGACANCWAPADLHHTTTRRTS